MSVIQINHDANVNELKKKQKTEITAVIDDELQEAV